MSCKSVKNIKRHTGLVLVLENWKIRQKFLNVNIPFKLISLRLKNPINSDSFAKIKLESTTLNNIIINI